MKLNSLDIVLICTVVNLNILYSITLISVFFAVWLTHFGGKTSIMQWYVTVLKKSLRKKLDIKICKIN